MKFVCAQPKNVFTPRIAKLAIPIINVLTREGLGDPQEQVLKEFENTIANREFMREQGESGFFLARASEEFARIIRNGRSKRPDPKTMEFATLINPSWKVTQHCDSLSPILDRLMKSENYDYNTYHTLLIYKRFLADVSNKLIESIEATKSRANKNHVQQILNWLDSIAPYLDLDAAKYGSLVRDKKEISDTDFESFRNEMEALASGIRRLAQMIKTVARVHKATTSDKIDSALPQLLTQIRGPYMSGHLVYLAGLENLRASLSFTSGTFSAFQADEAIRFLNALKYNTKAIKSKPTDIVYIGGGSVYFPEDNLQVTMDDVNGDNCSVDPKYHKLTDIYDFFLKSDKNAQLVSTYMGVFNHPPPTLGDFATSVVLEESNLTKKVNNIWISNLVKYWCEKHRIQLTQHLEENWNKIFNETSLLYEFKNQMNVLKITPFDNYSICSQVKLDTQCDGSRTKLKKAFDCGTVQLIFHRKLAKLLPRWYVTIQRLAAEGKIGAELTKWVGEHHHLYKAVPKDDDLTRAYSKAPSFQEFRELAFKEILSMVRATMTESGLTNYLSFKVRDEIF